MFFYPLRFVRGNKPGSNTGFDINGDDLLEMEQCDEIVVASAVFGMIKQNYIIFGVL